MQTIFSILIILLTMRCAVVYYIFCWNFLLFESLATASSKIARIIGGRDADADDETKYQYVVRLQIQIINSETSEMLVQLHRCTAAVLTPSWSLIAGHCLNNEDVELVIDPKKMTLKLIILYGSHNDTSLVTETIVHPSYKLTMKTINSDIALIRHRPITLNLYARLSALDYVSMIGQEVTLVGYGTTNSTVTINGTLFHIMSDTTELGKPLQLLDALIVQCIAARALRPGMCLARRCNKLSGVCSGDSGGPVIHDSGVVGVNSAGSQEMLKFCGLKPYNTFYDPGYITPTSTFIDWISSIIKS